MKSEFDNFVKRRNTNSLKWNVEENVLPMWVADMDFKCAPCVQQAMQKIVDYGIYGYSDIPDSYYISYQTWWKCRHHFDMKKEWMIFSSGVIPALSSIIRRITLPAENVLIQSPVYNIFYNSIQNNGRNVISSDLVYEYGNYHIDFDDLEQKLKDPQTTMMIICNPHNPIGRIWSRLELERIGALCYKHHVVVLSDEVHCDITMQGCSYVPFASINETCAQNSITCLSASKAFNLAGLQAACLVIPNPVIRHRVNRGIQNDEVGESNIFACAASISAFEEGASWLDEVNAYIQSNKEVAKEFIEQQIPQLYIVPSKATYLLWIDCEHLACNVDLLTTYLLESNGLKITSGSAYGVNGKNFIRINIACPKERMMDGLNRLKKGIEEFKIR